MKIVQQLSELRKAEDQATAERARAEYAADFPTFFSYKKNGVSHIKTKPSDIAKTSITQRDLRCRFRW